MATPDPTPPPAPRPPSQWKPSRRTWLWALLAFGVGLVQYVNAMSSNPDTAFFSAGGVPPATSQPDDAPLPAPIAGESGAGIGPLEPPPPEPRPVERPAPRPAPAPVAQAQPEAPVASSAVDRKPRPIPGQTPPPDYPPRALRSGERGTVLVVVYIGPDGVPTSTSLAQSSGSRDLDRAAMQAVRRWRFEPAMAGGQPTVGQVIVPIDVNLGD